MNRDRWERVAHLYQAALERPISDRTTFLLDQCHGDADLRREVESLLAEDLRAGPLDRPMWESAAELLGDEIRLAAGTCLGPYRLDRMVGAGGMGEVYRATDTRLDRTVAIKILPPDVSTDAEFRERFDREARAIAGLSHPHICTLYDIGHHDTIDFLVLEYLEGETLAARLEKGALPLDQALRHAIAIAGALALAHRSGIVHRDLKPANIFLTWGGGGSSISPNAKLLDFGLAKPSGSPIAVSMSRIATTPPGLTAKGTIIGTFQYMAPEQLEGQPADARSDIFALGAVVYEMVTGRKAFEGESHASLIGAILKDEPPGLDQNQPLAPPHLDHVVRRCLAKDPDARWQSASDVARELGWISETSDSVAASASYTRGRFDRRRIGWPVPAAVAAMIVLTAIIAAWVYRSRPSADISVYRASLTLPSDVRLAGVAPAERLAISPDGRQLAYVVREADGTIRLWLRALDSTSGRPLAGTEGAWGPFWSPDSRSVAFFTSTDHKLKRIEVSSGTLVTVCDLGDALPPGLGGTWNSVGVILFSRVGSPGVQRVLSSGGTVSSVTSPDASAGETRHVDPYFLPDGHQRAPPRGSAPCRTTISE